MNNTIKAVALGLSLLLVGVWYAQDFDKGSAAYKKKDYAAALREWRPLAEKGDADAQFIVGAMYEYGQGVPQNAAEAVKWYRLAAEQGYEVAQFIVGAMYQDGQGVPQNAAEAVKWYRLAADQGNGGAQFALDVMYGKIQGLP